MLNATLSSPTPLLVTVSDQSRPHAGAVPTVAVEGEPFPSAAALVSGSDCAAVATIAVVGLWRGHRTKS
jgi:hypothetical protein